MFSQIQCPLETLRTLLTHFLFRLSFPGHWLFVRFSYVDLGVFTYKATLRNYIDLQYNTFADCCRQSYIEQGSGYSGWACVSLSRALVGVGVLIVLSSIRTCSNMTVLININTQHLASAANCWHLAPQLHTSCCNI